MRRPEVGDRETPKLRLAMVHQYPNQEVVDGNAAMASVPGISVTDAKRKVDPSMNHAKVAFDPQDSAVDSHQGTRVTTVNSRLFCRFRPRPKNPQFEGCEVDDRAACAVFRPRGRRTTEHFWDRRAHSTSSTTAAASPRSQCSFSRCPGAHAVRLFSTSGLFIPEISRSRPFVCSPPRLSPRAGRAAGEQVKREGSAEASYAVRPHLARAFPPSRLFSAVAQPPPRPVRRTERTLRPGAIRCARVAFVRVSRAKIRSVVRDRKPVSQPVGGSFRKRSKRRSISIFRSPVSKRRLTRALPPAFFRSRLERRRRATTLRADPPPRTARARFARTATASPTAAATSRTRARARSRLATTLLRRAAPAAIRRRRRGCGTPPPAAGRAARGRGTTGSPGGSRRRRRRRPQPWRRPCRVGRWRRLRQKRPSARMPRRRRFRRTCA